MANARKCDRCEKCFDPINMTGMSCRFRNPIFQTSNDIREGVVGKLMVNDTPDAWVDLCPECAEMFEAFMCGAEPPAKPVTAGDESGTPLTDIFGTLFGFNKPREDNNDG